MKPLCKTLVSATLMMFLAVGCYNVTVKHEYDIRTDFDRLETYDWFPLLQKAQVSEDDMQNVKETVNEELESKGFRVSETGPDFLVALHFDRRPINELQEWEFTEQLERDLELESRRVKVQHEAVTIYIYLIHAETRELFWNGSALVNIFPDYSQKTITKVYKQAAVEVLREFPPMVEGVGADTP